MTVKRRIIRKKKKNEASEALAKVSGVEELERAATILKERAKRRLKELKNLNKKITLKIVLKSLKHRDKSDRERKDQIKDKKETIERIQKEKMKTQTVQNKVEDDKIKRLKELDNLRKSGILTNQEFEKLKSDLMN